MGLSKEQFKLEAKTLLFPVAQKFDMQYHSVNDHSVALIGKNFILVFLFDKWNTDITYLFYDGKNIIEYPINNFVRSQVTAEDKKNIVWKTGMFDHALSDLKIIINILQNSQQNILKGNLKWVSEYNKSKYGYRPEISNLYDTSQLINLLKNYNQTQQN